MDGNAEERVLEEGSIGIWEDHKRRVKWLGLVKEEDQLGVCIPGTGSDIKIGAQLHQVAVLLAQCEDYFVKDSNVAQ